MGNTFTRDTNDTIHWNSLKTENLSGGNDNTYSAMSQDSKLLLNRLELNLPKMENNSEEMSDLDNIFSKPKLSSNMKPLVGGGLIGAGLVSESEVNEPVQNNQEDLSATSPFISSEMYNILMNNQTQTGGAIVKKSIQKGGKIEGDDSSTSSTSSSNMDSDDSSSEESEKKKKTKGKKNLKGGKKIVSESSNSNELSYISSSAHTGKAESSSESVSESSSASESVSDSVEKTELTGGYESSSDNYVTSVKSNEVSTIKNLNNNLPNSSINTSDINMITE